MKKIGKAIAKIVEGILNLGAALVGISVLIAWGVSFVYLSYGLAIWAVQWFGSLI